MIHGSLNSINLQPHQVQLNAPPIKLLRDYHDVNLSEMIYSVMSGMLNLS